MSDRIKAAILASFIADSLALGAHWIYDPKEIAALGPIEGPRAPAPGSFHQGKQAGDFTHYGDQALLLFVSVVRHQGFVADAFADEWRQYMSSYNGYLDKASKATLARMAEGTALSQAGSSSTDLGGAARIAALVACYQSDKAKLIAAARAQTAITHNHPATIAGADFIARVIWAVLQGGRLGEAINEALNEGVAELSLEMALRASLESVNQETTTVVQRFGQHCGIESALPGALHVALRYEHDLAAGLLANVMAGGDSAARGLVAGMILGAHGGLDAIPPLWLASVRQQEKIEALLHQALSQTQ